jgi:hypothetical protein
MKDFRSLKVWGKAHALTLAIYKSTAQFPKQELYSFRERFGIPLSPVCVLARTRLSHGYFDTP